MKKIQLSRRLVLEQPEILSDGAGGYARAWTPVGTLWGEIVSGLGREAFGVEVSVSTVNYRITVRGAPVGSTARPKAEQRLRDGSRVFVILAVSERDGEGHYLTCIAREELPT